MRRQAIHGRPGRLAVFTIVAVAIGVLVAFVPGCDNRHGRASAEELNNVRQVKFALDGFATDFDGHYPSAATGLQIVPGGTGTAWSNDYFRQLFVVGETQSETIFWAKNSKVCSKNPPDDIVMQNGKVDPALVLEAGDCHWAYLTDQTNTSHVDRVLIVEGFVPGTAEWDSKRIDHKVVALRVDGSAKALRMNRAGEVLDSTGDPILSPHTMAWKGSGQDPRKLLVQPQPRRR